MNKNTKVVSLSTGKQLFVYDNVISFDELQVLFKKIKSTPFYSDGTDGSFDNKEDDLRNQMIYTVDEDSYKKSQIEDIDGFKYVFNKHNLFNKKIKQCLINLTTSFDRTTAHTDGKGLTLIYYPNCYWDLLWGGHTQFLTEDISEIEYILTYRPGRIIVFDGTIPHNISPISTSCRRHRYSLVIQFTEEEK